MVYFSENLQKIIITLINKIRQINIESTHSPLDHYFKKTKSIDYDNLKVLDWTTLK